MTKSSIAKKIILRLVAIFIITELVLRSVVFLYNAYYVSVTSPDKHFDKKAFRIICVGESTTFGSPFRGNGYPEQLEGMLNKNFVDKKFQIFNLGIPATTSTEVAEHFNKNIIDYQPHLAIILLGQNYNGPGMLNLSKKEGFFNNIIFYTVDRLNRLKIIKLSNFVFSIFNAYKNNYLEIVRLYSDIYLHYNTYDDPSFRLALADHQRNLEHMLKIARRNKCKVLLCNYFNSGANSLLRELASKNNIPFSDNEKIYLEWKKINGSPSGVLSSDGWHPNVKGYSLMAENLYKTIIKYNLIK